MTYTEARDIARDAAQTETRYLVEDVEHMRKELRRQDEIIYQLAELLNLNIERNEGIRVTRRFPEDAMVGISGQAVPTNYPFGR